MSTVWSKCYVLGVHAQSKCVFCDVSCTILHRHDESPFKSLDDLIKSLRQRHLQDNTFEFVIHREKVVGDALKRVLKPTFKWNKKIEVLKSTQVALRLAVLL